MKIKFIIPALLSLALVSFKEDHQLSKSDAQTKSVSGQFTSDHLNHNATTNVRLRAGDLAKGEHIYVQLVSSIGGAAISQQYAMVGNEQIAFEMTPGTTYIVEVHIENGEVFYSAEATVPNSPHYMAHTMSKNSSGISIVNWIV